MFSCVVVVRRCSLSSAGAAASPTTRPPSQSRPRAVSKGHVRSPIILKLRCKGRCHALRASGFHGFNCNLTHWSKAAAMAPTGRLAESGTQRTRGSLRSKATDPQMSIYWPINGTGSHRLERTSAFSGSYVTPPTEPTRPPDADGYLNPTVSISIPWESLRSTSAASCLAANNAITAGRPRSGCL